MKKYTLLLYIILLSTSTVNSQELYRIYFTDKGNQILEFENELYNNILLGLDENAIQRRILNLNSDNILSEKDIPIYEKYLDSLTNLGLVIKSKLKWYNYIVSEMYPNILESVLEIEFIDTIQQVKEHYIAGRNTSDFINCGTFDYDISFNHLNMLNIPELHRYGFTGKGARIGFLDSGFDWLNHKSTKNTNVVKSYDFIFRDSVVFDQMEDIDGQDNHGSVVLATVSALDNNKFIGIAPNAEFYLAKTEDLRSETYYELDLFAEALIWMENNGVDIINASLGYTQLDTLPLDYSNLDGNYTIASIAINDASALGMICVISNGNNGDKPGSLGAPADADSSVAVGALNSDGETLVGFSSNGPNSSGVMKPNLVAQGANIFSINPNSEDQYGSTAGTSLSSPLIAGSFALLRSIYSETSTYELKQNMYESADNFDNPDNRFGFGLPNVFQAVYNLGVAISPDNQLENGDFKRLVFYIFPENQVLEALLEVEYSEFNSKEYPLVRKGTDNQYFVDIPKDEFEDFMAKGRVVVKSYDSYYYYPSSINKFDIFLDGDFVQCGVNKIDIIPQDVFDPDNEFEVYPTVITNYGKFNIALKLNDYYNIDISVSNVQGKIITNESLNYGPGVLNKEFTLNIINSGAYFISVHYGGKQFHKKVIFIN